MTIFRNPEEHTAHPPSSWWVVKKADRVWWLTCGDGEYPLESFSTKRAAELAREVGWLVKQYEADGRWYEGETPAGHRSWSECRMDQLARQS